MTGLLAQAAAGSAAEAVVFWVFAVIALGAAIAMISMRNIMHAALMLVANLLAIAVLFLGLESAFLSIVQVIVYGGAIMVLFLFVIMLLGVDRDDLLIAIGRGQRIGAGAAGLALAVLLVVAFVGPYTSAASRCGAEEDPGGDAVACAGLGQALAEEEQGSVSLLAGRMFTRYTFPFEASALLLVVATIGAIVLGRRSDLDPALDPAYTPSGPPLPEPDPDDSEE